MQLATWTDELALIARLAGAFPRSPLQINALQESDAELLRLPGFPGTLAVTTDAVVEEIHRGLYDDPWLAGWMVVLVNASDLAAVGAEPIGLLLSETLPANADLAWLDRLQAGIRDASLACALPVLGGDTNFAERLQLAGFALGVVPVGEPLKRAGCRPGDDLYLSGPAGQGSAFALAKLADVRTDDDAVGFLPRPRLHEGRLLRNFARCCIDTSDGVLAAIDQLMRAGGCGFEITVEMTDYLQPAALRAARAFGLAPWTMLAGPHGEFELLFCVPAERRGDFLAAARATLGWEPLRLGQATTTAGLRLRDGERRLALNTARIRSLYAQSRGRLDTYVEALLEEDRITVLVAGTPRPRP